MKADLMNDLANFFEERLGKALFTLQESNEEYRNLSNEFETLLNTGSQDIEVYRQALTKIAVIKQKLSDIEKHYLYLAGIREKAIIENTLSSESFEKLFTDIN